MEGSSETTRGVHQSRTNHDLTFRLAQSNDLNVILKVLEGIYDGEDYVPVRFHRWMKMQDLAVMLTYSGEKPVGLFAKNICRSRGACCTGVSRTRRS